jgi:alkanesulfonate monooxygenase SsuD/methylene tetrahydromethanopterin reductase-like flavin-dependent oxidoreductase (luciferase family)
MDRQSPEFGICSYNTQSTYVRPRRHPYLFREAIAEARRAEQLGFTSFWLGEHHFSYDGYLPSIVPALSHYASGTEKIAVGAGIMLFPLRTAEEVARQCQAFALAHPGRTLRLAMAAGYARVEFLAHRVPLKERGKLMERQLDELLGEQRERFGPTELWMGGHVDRAFQRAGRYGASLFLAMNNGPERLREIREIWGEQLPSDAHRPRIAIAGEIWADDNAQTREYVRRRLYESWKTYEIYFEADTENAANLGVVAKGIDREKWLEGMMGMSVIDEPGVVVDYLGELIEAGADEIVFRLRYDGTSHGQVEEALGRLSSDVIPQLKGRASDRKEEVW